MGSITALFVASYKQPVIKHLTARFIVFWGALIWCLYGDDRAILEASEKEQNKRQQASWKRANEMKRTKR